MILIRTAGALARALAQPPDPELKCILQAHADRLTEYDFEDIAMFVVVEPGDTLDSIDQALGWSLLAGDTFAKPVELIAEHQSYWEVVFILSDDGFGLVLFVHRDANRRLIAACEQA